MKAALAGAFVAGALLGAAGLAMAEAQAQRQLLSRIDIAGTARVAHLGVAAFPAGAAFPPHTHPGEEISYVVEGQVIFAVAGQPPRLLKAGDTFAVPRDTVHQARAAPGHTARVVAVWITDKGQPLAQPAP